MVEGATAATLELESFLTPSGDRLDNVTQVE